MKEYKPSIFARLEHQKSSRIFFVLGFGFSIQAIVALINVAVFYFMLSTFGFLYSVAIFTVLHNLNFYLSEYSKYRMEQQIMKGGK